MAAKGGRPSDYTAQKAVKICELIANGKTIKQISMMDGMPHPSNVYRWLAKHEEFREMYARAKEQQIEVLVDEMIAIADDCRRDVEVRTDKNGNEYEVTNNEVVQRAKLMIDTRKWLAAKLMPRKYGDRQTIEHEGNITIDAVLQRGRERAAKREKPED